MLLTAYTLQAQPPKMMTARTVIKFSPQHLLENTAKVGTEIFDHKRRNSFQLFVSATWRNEYPVGRNEERLLEGLGAELQYRYYIIPFASFSSTKQENAFGFYIGAFGQGTGYKDTYTSTWEFRNPDTGESRLEDFHYQDLHRVYALGGVIGIQRTFWRKLVIELFGGAGQRFVESDTDGARYIPPDCVDCAEMREEEKWRYPALDYVGIFPKAGFNIGLAF